MTKRLWLLLLSLMVNTGLSAQKKNDERHLHHRNEMAVSNAPVYFLNENELAYGLHFHYIHTLGESHFGLGVGYERIFDEHGHHTIGLVGSYRPFEALVFNLAPGLTFEHHNPDQLNFAMHAEAAWEIEVGNFHLGPGVEVAYDPEDIHFSLGLHLGYGF